MKRAAFSLILAVPACFNLTAAAECGDYFDLGTNPLRKGVLLLGLTRVADSGARRLEQLECVEFPCADIYRKEISYFDRSGRLVASFDVSHPDSQDTNTVGYVYNYADNSRYPNRLYHLWVNGPFNPDTDNPEPFVVNVNELSIGQDGLWPRQMCSRTGRTLTCAEPETGQFEIYEDDRLKSKRFIALGGFGLERGELADLDCQYSRNRRGTLIKGTTRKVRGPVVAKKLMQLDENGELLQLRNELNVWTIEIEFDYSNLDAKGNWMRRITRSRGGVDGPSTRTSVTTRRIDYW